MKIITLKEVKASKLYNETWQIARQVGVPKERWAMLLHDALTTSLGSVWSLEHRRSEALFASSNCSLINAFSWDSTGNFYICDPINQSLLAPSRMEIAVSTNHYYIKGVKYPCSYKLRKKYNDATFDFVADPNFYGKCALEELE